LGGGRKNGCSGLGLILRNPGPRKKGDREEKKKKKKKKKRLKKERKATQIARGTARSGG